MAALGCPAACLACCRPLRRGRRRRRHPAVPGWPLLDCVQAVSLLKKEWRALLSLRHGTPGKHGLPLACLDTSCPMADFGTTHLDDGGMRRLMHRHGQILVRIATLQQFAPCFELGNPCSMAFGLLSCHLSRCGGVLSSRFHLLSRGLCFLLCSFCLLAGCLQLLLMLCFLLPAAGVPCTLQLLLCRPRN